MLRLLPLVAASFVVIAVTFVTTRCDGQLIDQLVNITVDGWTVYVPRTTSLCNVDEGCASSNPDARVTCRCDPNCHFFKDCCFDYADRCGHGTGVASLEGITSDRVHCIVPPESAPSPCAPGYMMVDRCAPDWRNNVTRFKCEGNGNDDDPYSLIPVSIEPLVTFKNVYCSICNRKSFSDVSIWRFQADCSPEFTNTSSQSSSISEIQQLIANCPSWAFAPPSTDSIAARTCDACLIDACPLMTKEESYLSLVRACDAYLGTVDIATESNERQYRNAHCYLCNDFEAVRAGTAITRFVGTALQESTDLPISTAAPTSTSSTTSVSTPLSSTSRVTNEPPVDSGLGGLGGIGGFRPIAGVAGVAGVAAPYIQPDISDLTDISDISDLFIRVDTLVSISRLVDFTTFDEGYLDEVPIHAQPILEHCPDEHVFDPSIQECIQLSCPRGYRIYNRSCVSDHREVSNCTSHESVPLTFKFTCGHLERIEADNVQDCAENGVVVEEYSRVLRNVLSPLHHIVSQNITVIPRNSRLYDQHICYRDITLSVEMRRKSVDFEKLRLSISSEITFAELYNTTCPATNVHMSVGCIRNTNEDCNNKSTYVSGGFETSSRNNETSFFIYNRNETYSIEEALYSIQLERTDRKSRYNITETLLVCEDDNDIPVCPTVMLNASDFVFLRNDTIFHPHNKTFGPGEFFIINNDSIEVCSFFNASGEVIRDYRFISFSPGQSITSLVGSLLSVVAVAFSFVTYLKFESIRKSICSKLIMSICVCLSGAQLLVLVSGVATSNTKLCAAVAVLGHYLWLAVFAHSLALAVDLYRRFGFTHAAGKTSEGRKMLLKFLAFAWGAPLVIVIPCLIIYLVDQSNIKLKYGTRAFCWISNGFTNLYAFGIPVAFAIVLNGILFTLVVIGLWRRKDATKKNKKMSDVVSDLVIYLKMSTLLGFTWLFGFLAAFVDVTALWYIFIILNSLQGVYIFLAFTCNKRVFKLWRESCSCRPCSSLSIRCPRWTSKSNESSSSASATTTSTTNTASTSKAVSKTTSAETISMSNSTGNVMTELKKNLESRI